MVKVTNLATLQTAEYSCSPEEAVIAAHAQQHGDFNTWEYRSRYGGMGPFLAPSQPRRESNHATT